MSHPDKCTHDKTWAEECLQCEKVGLLEMIESWSPKIERAKARIAEIDGTDKPDVRPACYSCGCRSDRPRNWMGRSICSKCSPATTSKDPKS